MTDFVKEEPEYLEIEGVKYAKDLFRAWGKDGVAVGQLFKLFSRNDGVITIQIIRD